MPPEGHRPPGNKSRPPRPAGPSAAEVAKEKAKELIASGMPAPMAIVVSLGKLTFNQALERMARRHEVERLMRKHDLSRAIATQVVMGHASLDAYLQRRRLEAHRDSFRAASCLDDALGKGHALTILLHGARRIDAKVTAVSPYEVTVQVVGGGEEVIHKLQLKVAWKVDDYKRVKKVLRKDKALTEAPRPPIDRPQDRYSCSDKRLFRYVDAHTPIEVTLLEGEVVSGVVSWFGRYEFGLSHKGEPLVTVFRHAIHDIKEPAT